MVDTSNLPQVNSLMQRYINYRQALDVIDHDGRIASFALTGPGGLVQVAAHDIEYPQQMLDAIRNQVRRRLDDLEDDLAKLGVELNGVRR